MILSSWALIGCGGDGSSGGSTNIDNAAEAFSNPDGTVTENNADEAVQKAVDATRANAQGQAGGGLGGGFFSVEPSQPKAIEDCIDVNTSNGSTVVDYACLGPELGEDCVGQGTVSTSVASFNSDGSGVFNTQYDNAGFSCGGSPAYSCNGPAQTSISGNTIIICQNLTCTYDGESVPSDGCFTFDAVTGNNLVLVTLDDGQVVCVAIVANTDCSQTCSEWRDAQGDSRIVCDVTETDGTCSQDGTTIVSVANCEVDRTQTSCAGF